MMTIDFYWNNSSEEHVYKDITPITAVVDGSTQSISHYEGTLRDESSIIDPIFRIETIDGDDTFAWKRVNYFYVEQWDRYYYITDIICVRKHLYEFHGHVDVLMSFKEQLEDCPCIVANQESDWNMYLDDGSCRVYQNPHFEIRKFSNYFGNHQIILAVAGDGAVT